MSNLLLRDATINDMDLVFQWRNDPWIIEKGSLNKTVTWEEHQNWFNRFLSADTGHMFIIESDDNPIGQVRFVGNEKARYADISVYLMKDNIGKGMGSEAIEKACSEIGKLLEINYVVAHILSGNKQSVRAFEKAGFVKLDGSDIKDLDMQNKENHTTYYKMVKS